MPRPSGARSRRCGAGVAGPAPPRLLRGRARTGAAPAAAGFLATPDGLCRPTTKRWQPQTRAKAKEKAATTDGIVIDTRALLGYTAPIGTTDQDRIRHLTVAFPPQYAARLFDAQEQGAGDQRLQEIAAEALRDVYFQDGGRRAGSLEEVRFTDVEHIEFDL
ncbi:telomere-protecting terminal protein Tpg [Streptomyces sp. NPDC059837]|uniref:telomere-protecting terminal protein Tpg n=2 Tax=unclassified Streptomyces TaxID=2593676 RepID=UPI00365FD719